MNLRFWSSPLKFTSLSGKDYNLGCVLELENFSTVIIISEVVEVCTSSGRAVRVCHCCLRWRQFFKHPHQGVVQISWKVFISRFLQPILWCLLFSPLLLPYIHFFMTTHIFYCHLKNDNIKKRQRRSFIVVTIRIDFFLTSSKKNRFIRIFRSIRIHVIHKAYLTDNTDSDRGPENVPDSKHGMVSMS